MNVCTIIAKNYLAQARVLARSFKAHHPDIAFHVLVIDDVEAYIDPANEPFELVTIPKLGIERFQDMAVMYSVLELSTAVKPWLLKYLLGRTEDNAVVYLDPDMRLYAPLDEMFAAVRAHGLVLSPHNLGSMPRDGRKPNEQDILIAGVYNLGFVGINAGAFADELLDWWAERLERDCIVDPERGFFVDQRWMDFAPGMAESFQLLRDPGFNVAYWNLHARPVTQRDGSWFVSGDVPLRLFHFSGYDPARPHLLSRHQDRIDLERELGLRRLCDEYADALRAEGIDEVAAFPYTYATTESGIPLDGVLRRLYRDLTLERRDVSPFDADGEAAFLAALNAPVFPGGVTRYLSAVYDARPELQRAYPDLGGADGEGLVGWAREWGREQVPIADALLPGGSPAEDAPAPQAEPEPPRRTPPPLGVNVAGYLTSEMGVGEVARQMMGALDMGGVATLPVGIVAPRGRHGHEFAGVDAGRAAHPVNLVCVNADMLPQFAADAGPDFFAHRYTIGMWWWEVSKFPERWNNAFKLVDEIWAGSRFVADALSAVSPVPVVHVPLPVTLPGHPLSARDALGLPEGFVFLYVYDYNSVFARKNPLGVLEAFRRAFPDAGGPSLVLKSINAEHHPEDHARLAAAAEGHSHVHLLDQFLSPTYKDRLLESADAYVSLHRSEGFGITMAESMLLGKPVIATNFSGNTDFMTHENSWPVRYELVPIGPDADPYPADGWWAEPDLDHAAACMRDVFEDRDEVRRRGAQAAADITAHHSLMAAGAAIRGRLTALELDPDGWVAPGADARERAGSARWLLDRGSPPPGGTRALPGRSAARKALLRTIKPYTSHQGSVDRELISSVDALADQVDVLARRALELDTGTLRWLRVLERRIAALETGAGGDLGGQLRDAKARLDDVSTQVGELRQDVTVRTQALFPPGGTRPEAPQNPWTHQYNERHREFVLRELDDPDLLKAFGEGAALPDGFGVGFDERVIEFPWLAAHDLGGMVLDAGSTLNHLHVLSRMRPRMDRLHVVTLAPEPMNFPEVGVSYLYADLRDLPLRDATYDRVLSLSTLEHVGLDNSYYGAGEVREGDPERELLTALAELKRVLAPGGDCYISVPAGLGERFEWVRTVTDAELGRVIEAFAPARHTLIYYRYTAAGWQLSDADAVADETYRDHFTSGPVGADRAVAARAVACLHLVKEPMKLPLPPLAMRELIGSFDEATWDNPTGTPIWSGLPDEAWDVYLDFGCGCGREARRLLLQTPRPNRYVGVDIHAGMVRWCDENFVLLDPGFSFVYHPVYSPGLSPDPLLPWAAPLPVEDGVVTIMEATSVFTHLIESQAEYYLDEVARVLAPDGLLIATWFLFDKSGFPFMQDTQHALYINDRDPTNAVVFDRVWLYETLTARGLGVVQADAPAIRGYHWQLRIGRVGAGREVEDLPPDDAPFGHAPPPLLRVGAHRIGLDEGASEGAVHRERLPLPAPSPLAVELAAAKEYIASLESQLAIAQRACAAPGGLRGRVRDALRR